MMDLSALSNHLIRVLEYVGVAATVGVAGVRLIRRDRVDRALVGGARVVIPFVSPLIVIGGGGILAWVTRRLGYPIRGSGGVVGPLTRTVNSGISAFGPLGAVALFGVAVLTLVAYLTRRCDARQLVLALSLPVFLVLLALQSKWNAFLPRFFLVPVALTAPLLARLLRGRVVALAYLVVAATVLWVTVTNDQGKPLKSAYGRPWRLTPVEAIVLGDPQDATMMAAYDRLVPQPACVGAVLGRNEPVYLLFGPRLGRDVVFLANESLTPGEDTVEEAYRSGASYVVISTALANASPGTRGRFRRSSALPAGGSGVSAGTGCSRPRRVSCRADAPLERSPVACRNTPPGLAAVLGVNTNTVLWALRELRDEGLLEFRRGRGITVAGTPQQGEVIEQARQLVGLARRHGYRLDELIRIIKAVG